MELFAKRMTWELDNDEGLSCLFFELEDGYFTLSRKTGAEALRLEMNDPANGQLIDPDCFEYAVDNTRFRLNIVRNNRKVLRTENCIIFTHFFRENNSVIVGRNNCPFCLFLLTHTDGGEQGTDTNPCST